MTEDSGMTGAEQIEKIKSILTGIDQTEIESKDGWWKTSTGAEFGANKLREVLDVMSESVWKPVEPGSGRSYKVRYIERTGKVIETEAWWDGYGWIFTRYPECKWDKPPKVIEWTEIPK